MTPAEAFLRELPQHRRRHCPCCGVPLRTKKTRNGYPMARSQTSRGHDRSVAAGGSRSEWIAICHGCNNDQGWLDFRSWARLLRSKDDNRAEAVERIADFFDRWRQLNGSVLVPTPARRRADDVENAGLDT